MGIRKYIEYGGTRMPSDFDLFKIGGPKEGLCVMCRSAEHAHFPVYIFKSRLNASGAIFTKTHACAMCAEDILDMERNIEGAPDIRGSLFGPPVNGEEERVRLFIEDGRFDSSVHNHYQHLDTQDFPQVSRCYLCKKKVSDKAAGMDLERWGRMKSHIVRVPVSMGEEFTGGDILICHGCLTTKLESSIDFDGLELSSMKRAVEVICVKCENRYLIDTSEHEYRQHSGNLNFHCPACAYNEFINKPPSPIKGEEEPYKRLIQRFCGFCNSIFHVDHMMPYDHNKQNFVSKDGRLMCEDCIGASGESPIVCMSIGGGSLVLIYSAKSPNKYKVVLQNSSRRVIKEYFKKGSIDDVITTVKVKEMARRKSGYRELFL